AVAGLPPAAVAVDGDGDEHGLPSGLAQEVGRVAGVEDAADEDGEQQQVAHDADGPGPDLATHAADGAGQPEDVADDLAGQQRAAADGDVGVEDVSEPPQGVHRSSS